MNNEWGKELSIDMFNRLKNTVYGKVRCTPNEAENRLYIEIGQIGVIYKMHIENLSDIMDNEQKIEIEFDKVVRKYRAFINHKFFK